MYNKKCALCGDEFTTNRKRDRYCNKIHENKCPVCGKIYIQHSTKDIACHMPHEAKCFNCGDDIMVKRIYKGQTRFACGKTECRLASGKATNLEKYGVENPFASEQVKDKIKQTNLEKYGVEHPSQNRAVMAKQQSTMVEKYGVKYALQNKAIQDKAKKTNLARYGVDNVAKSPSFQAKARQTNMAKYGVESTAQLATSKAKAKQTFIDKYGTSDPIHENATVKAKADASNLARYGSRNVMDSPIIREKIKKSNQAKFGVDWSTQSTSIQAKMKQSLIDRYGVDNPGKSKEIQRRMALTARKNSLNRYKIKDNKDKEDTIELLWTRYVSKSGKIKDNTYDNFKQYFNSHILCRSELSNYCNITYSSVRRMIKRVGLEDRFESLTKSKKEELLITVLETELSSVKYYHNDRVVLDGSELDFYFPDNNLAVEISPTSTHNSMTSGWNSKQGKPTVYHKNKFLACADKNIELITIFDWHDWDKMIELIKTKLNNSNKRIYARKTTYLEYNELNDELKANLSDWHILSLAKNTKKDMVVGTLVYNNETVGIALWDNKDNTSELKRMVFRPQYSIVGGASKLLKNYVNNHDVSKITTYSDCDLGRGQVYKTIGFKLIEQSKPVLNFYNPKLNKNIKYLSLVRQGSDRLLKDIPDYKPVGIGDDKPSNIQIVEQYGFLPVYDCGYRKWELTIL